MKKTNKILAFGIVLCMLFSLAVVPVGAAIVDSGTCGDNLTWKLDSNGTLTISGTGDMRNYNNTNSPWYGSRSSIRTVIIQNGVTSIGNSAFYGCYSLTSVIIPDSVTSIGDWAFSGCSSLTSVIIPDSVTSIWLNPFSHCSSLTSINVSKNNQNLSSQDGVLFNKNKTVLICCPGGKSGEYIIPDSVTSFENSAFSGCESLTSVIIPDSVTSIWYHAFSGYSSLTSVIIPDSVISIEDYAFYGCSSLTSVIIPDSVISIADKAFDSCSSLTSINVSENNQDYSSQDGVLFNKNKTILKCCPGGKSGEYIIPDSVTSIWSYAFSNCSSLTSVIIPDSVTSIKNSAFYGCESLTSVIIPDSVTSIWYFAFEGCSSLTSVIIPDSVTSIGDGAFSYCSSLTDVYYSGTAANWNKISIASSNTELTTATKHYNHIQSKSLAESKDYNGKTVALLENGVLDIGENLYFRNGYVNATNGYIKAGDKKITGENIYFTNSGKIRLQDGYTAKVEKDNGNGTTDQGFMVGMENPRSLITMTLEVTGTANDVDYTGKTISKDFDFTNYEVAVLVNFGFTVTNIPKPLSLSIQSIE